MNGLSVEIDKSQRIVEQQVAQSKENYEVLTERANAFAQKQGFIDADTAEQAGIETGLTK